MLCQLIDWNWDEFAMSVHSCMDIVYKAQARVHPLSVWKGRIVILCHNACGCIVNLECSQVINEPTVNIDIILSLDPETKAYICLATTGGDIDI